MTTYRPTLCMSCANLRPGKVTCDAFPDGIPDDIVVWGGDHRQPVEGDGGIVYELDPPKEPALNDWLFTRGELPAS